MQTTSSTTLVNLGSTFVKAAFLGHLSSGLGTNIFGGVHTAQYKGSIPGYSHGTDAAKPLALALSGAHDICAEFCVVDKDSLEELLEAIQEFFDDIQPEGDWDWSSEDQQWSREVLEHILSLASKTASAALEEVKSGFAIGGGDLGVWQQEVAHREAMSESVALPKKS